MVGRLMTLRTGFHAEALMGEAGSRLGQGTAIADVPAFGVQLGHHAAVLATADAYRVLGVLALALIPFVVMLQHIPAPMTRRPDSP